MSFMKPVIYQGDYYLVDGDHGTDLIPGDLLGDWLEIGQTMDACDDDPADPRYIAWKNLAVAVRHYIGNDEIYSVERCEGFYGRYSAPGYMDATDWHWGATEQEVSAELAELYGEQD